ncbi:MAG: hypothetical protein FWC97_09665 [Treponema sp.]|nr:hypothetical protein [Treponema sp.]
MFKKCFFTIVIFSVLSVFVFSQTHLSVPLGHPIYTVLEQAQMRGLHRSLPSVRPYSRAQILSIIDEILYNDENRRFGGLSEAERRILEEFRTDLTPARDGFDLVRGTISTEHYWNNVYFSAEFGFGMDINFSASHFFRGGGFSQDYSILDPLVRDDPNYIHFTANHPASGDSFVSFEFIPSMHLKGDLGRNVSYAVAIGLWGGAVPRTILGSYWNRVPIDNPRADETPRREMITYSGSLAHLPFSYRKGWGGWVFPIGGLRTSGMTFWPEGDLSLGYWMHPELSASLLNGHVFLRFARIDREWAGMTEGSSLVLNQSAQPFLAFETVIQPFSWISFSSLTGILEFSNKIGEPNVNVKIPASTFQNAFSINMVEFNFADHFFIGFGSTSVWSKRFELGYLFPFMDNFIYQSSTGDFDNMALFFNAQAQLPGLGRMWGSVFIDEMSPARDFLQMARMMYAYQLGIQLQIPWLPFATFTVSYTKNEPYNYTHLRVDVPWFPSDVMETNFVNMGRSLGHHIPPNSDEFLIRFTMLPAPRSLVSLQYQMIRHGATWGDRAVAGSSLWSELPRHGRHNDPRQRKYFLRDGAYQWMHILRVRGEHSFVGMNLPVSVFAEMGGVFSYFTDICNTIEPNSGSPNPFSVVRNNPQYPHSLSFVASIGIRLFPKF